jgi:hypothetical protein
LIKKYNTPVSEDIMVRFGETTFNNDLYNRQRHNGSIDDFRMYKDVLSIDNIKHIYNEENN